MKTSGWCSFFLVIAFCISGCAGMPPDTWSKNPDVEIEVHWHRFSGVGYIDGQGVCHYFAEDSEGGLLQVWPQVKKCLDQKKTQGLLSSSSKTPGTKTIKIFFADGPQDLQRRFVSVKGVSALRAVTKAQYENKNPHPIICQDGKGCGRIGGFAFDASVVIMLGLESTIGHEIKHLYDGEFHDMWWQWYKK